MFGPGARWQQQPTSSRHLNKALASLLPVNLGPNLKRCLHATKRGLKGPQSSVHGSEESRRDRP